MIGRALLITTAGGRNTLRVTLAHAAGARLGKARRVSLTLRLIGIILVTSLLVIPPAAARSLSRNLRQQIVLSICFGLVAGIGGIALSYQADMPSGPVIVLTSIILFAASITVSKFSKRTLSASA